MFNEIRKLFQFGDAHAQHTASLVCPGELGDTDDEHPGFFSQEELEDLELESSFTGVKIIQVEVTTVISGKRHKTGARSSRPHANRHSCFDPYTNFNDAFMVDASRAAGGQHGLFGTH